MRFPLLQRKIPGIPRFLSLRYRFIFTTAGMLVFILGMLALVLGYLQSRTIKQQLKERGLAIAQSLAAVSTANLITYNYIALERSANQAAQDPDIAYVIIYDKEGRVAGYSGRSDLQGKNMDDEVSQKSLAGDNPLIQEVKLPNSSIPVLDIAVPVLVSATQERWGTIRLSLSLAHMYHQLYQTQWSIFFIGLVALSCGTLLSIWTARRITRPLDDLVHSTQEAARGNLSQDIQISTNDEVEILASNFNIMIRDIITHREQLEKQLLEIKRMQSYTEKLLTTMGDGLLTVDMGGKVITINPAASMLLDVFCDQTIKSRHVSETLKNYPALDSYIHGVIENPGDRQAQEMQLPARNKVRIILVSCSILRNRRGKPREIILNMHDISALKELEASMRQTERLAALGTLAAGMAHEIRNPLSTIKTFVQLLPRKVEKPGFLEKFQRTVPRELNRINSLVGDLLDLARIPKYVFQSTSLKTLLKQTLDASSAELQTRHIKWRCEILDDLPQIQADAGQLTKAFQNLILNAAEAMREGGELKIGATFIRKESQGLYPTTDGSDRITVTFQDTGPGISDKDIKNIFNPFFTTKDIGTGLGLAITHKVITEHGGQIEVDSTEGRGSRFIIQLPV